MAQVSYVKGEQAPRPLTLREQAIAVIERVGESPGLVAAINCDSPKERKSFRAVLVRAYNRERKAGTWTGTLHVWTVPDDEVNLYAQYED